MARGARVTILCAAHAAAPPDEIVDGVRFVRRGTKLTVYREGVRALARGASSVRVDVVVDVQNGLPFFTRAATRGAGRRARAPRAPRAVAGGLPRASWAGSGGPSSTASRPGSTAPASTSRCRAPPATSSSALGVDRRRIAVVHNGTDPVIPTAPGKSTHPMIAVVGRLVPHKQVEHAIDAALELRREHPDLRLHVVGSGWWEAELHDYAAERGAGDTVVFEGHVDEQRKHEIYEQAWVLALPSLKEGWGLVIGEAGMHRTPTVAYRSAGGTRESMRDGVSGVLVDDRKSSQQRLRLGRVTTGALRTRLGDGAYEMSHRFTWQHAQESFAHVLATVLRGERIDAQDPDEE